MNKEDLLKRYKGENVDEGIEFENHKGDESGFFAMCIWILFLILFKLSKGEPTFDVISLPFVFLSGGIFKRYSLNKDKAVVNLAIVFTLISIACFGIYFFSIRKGVY